MDTQSVMDLANDINRAIQIQVEVSAKMWRKKLIDTQKERDKAMVGWQKCKLALQQYGDHSPACQHQSNVDYAKGRTCVCVCGLEEAVAAQ